MKEPARLRQSPRRSPRPVAASACTANAVSHSWLPLYPCSRATGGTLASDPPTKARLKWAVFHVAEWSSEGCIDPVISQTGGTGIDAAAAQLCQIALRARCKLEHQKVPNEVQSRREGAKQAAPASSCHPRPATGSPACAPGACRQSTSRPSCP